MDDLSTDRAAELGRMLAGLRDPVLRLGWAEDRIRRLSVNRLVALLAASMGERGRDPRQDDLFLAFTLVLIQPPHDERRRAVGSWALAHGPTELGWLFGRREEADPPPARQPVPDHGRGRPLTLGERKSLARGRDRQLLARALRDPHPDVAAILLANPALIEADVRRLASRRPIDPEVLRQILAQPRWAVRYAVRRGILQNPHLPLEVAMALAALLRRSDASSLAAAPGLRPALREVCQWAATPETAH